MEIIPLYFPDLTTEQFHRFQYMQELYAFWNEKINVVSRKDLPNLEIHHILHSLSVAKAFPFAPGTKIMDAGTGGGFPGIPLAVVFPEVTFTLVDSTGKKIKVVNEISKTLELQNVRTIKARVEDM